MLDDDKNEHEHEYGLGLALQGGGVGAILAWHMIPQMIDMIDDRRQALFGTRDSPIGGPKVTGGASTDWIRFCRVTP